MPELKSITQVKKEIDESKTLLHETVARLREILDELTKKHEEES